VTRPPDRKSDPVDIAGPLNLRCLTVTKQTLSVDPLLHAWRPSSGAV
jgi:hypothetical protein